MWIFNRPRGCVGGSELVFAVADGALVSRDGMKQWLQLVSGKDDGAEQEHTTA